MKDMGSIGPCRCGFHNRSDLHFVGIDHPPFLRFETWSRWDSSRTLEPKEAQLTLDNGWLSSFSAFSVKAVLICQKRHNCILSSRWAIKNGQLLTKRSYFLNISCTLIMHPSSVACSSSGIAPNSINARMVPLTHTVLRPVGTLTRP